MTTIQLKDLHPNPFRDLKRLPTKPEKVAVLKESIKETSFWDNVVCRKAPNGGGGYELAYGHNRWQALKELKWTEINIPVRDLDDTLMAKIMVRENHEEWGSYAEVDCEAARAVVIAFAEGKVKLRPVNNSRPGPVRIAPSFVPGVGADLSSRAERYDPQTLAEFLGWSVGKTVDVLTLLAFQESSPIGKDIDFSKLSSKQATEVIANAKRVERVTGDINAAVKIGRKLANEFRATSGKPGGRNLVERRAVSTHTARARTDELMREERVTRRRVERQEKEDKLNLQKENRQVKQCLDACKVFSTALQAAGKATSKFSPEAKRFTVRRLIEIGNEIILLKGRLG